MEQKTTKAATSLLMLLDTEGLCIFEDIPFLSLIRPLVRRDVRAGLSMSQVQIKYNITFSQARRIVESLRESNKTKNE